MNRYAVLIYSDLAQGAMTITHRQNHLAITIDNWVSAIEKEGGGDNEIYEKAWSQNVTFKELLDTSTQEQMDFLCNTYPGFYKYAKLLEMLAQGIQDGVIKVPTFH